MNYQVLIAREISRTGRELWLTEEGNIQVTSACCGVPVDEVGDKCTRCGVHVEHSGFSSNFTVVSAATYRGDAAWGDWLKHWFDLDNADMEFS